MTSGSHAALVEFWFDPGCPFTWRTSRWLVDVARRHPLDVRWQLMSLSVLNEGHEKPEGYWERRRRTDLALRVLAAANEAGGTEAVARLYGSLGSRRHEQGQEYDDELLRACVAEAALPAEVAAAAHEEKWDGVIRANHDEAQQRVGTESGSPIIALDGGRGYFGPVVVPSPSGAEADRLFEALRLLASVPAFSELKTGRAPV